MINKNYSPIKILLAGEGGQGVQTIAKALVKTAINQNLQATYLPSFGVEQRGTPSVAYVIISSNIISYPRFERADIVLVLSGRAIEVINKFITPNTDVIFDSSTIPLKSLPKISIHRLGLPATKISHQKFHPHSYNILAFGALSKKLNFDEKLAEKAISDVLAHKNISDKNKKLNHLAYIFGREAVYEKDSYTKAEYVSKKTPNITRNRDKKATILPDRCKGCGLCIENCPTGALSFGDDLGVFSTPIPKIDISKCIACGNCRRFCPDGAISVEKNKKVN